MSLRINLNSQATNAHQTLRANDSKLSQSIGRLSSGLRVNGAGDDPAGLVISEKLRAQVSGLGQAITNAGDAVNMVKTTEGALNEVHTTLRKMRNLALHAANTGATDAASAQADQAQINNAIDSLNKIAGETQFGDRKLLDGSAGIKSFINGSKVMAGNFSFAKGLQSGDEIKISISEAASQAKIVGAKAEGSDAVGYSSATYASGAATLGTAGNVAFTDKSGATRTVNYGAASTVNDLVSAVNSFGTSATGVTADFQASSGRISITKTDAAKGTDDTFKLTSAGTHAAAVSTATFASIDTAIGGAGSMTLLKDDGSEATVSWKATDQVSNVISSINNLGQAQTGITASYNATTGAIDLTKTGSKTGKADVLSWSAAGSHAASSSTATFSGLSATMSAGSLNLTTTDGSNASVSWATGSTVSDVISAVNALDTSKTGITASFNATTNKIELTKTDAVNGSNDVLSYTSRGSDAAISSAATFASADTAIGASAAGTLTLNLTNGTTANITMTAAMTAGELVSAVNALGTANTGITASLNGTTGAITFTKTDDRKGAGDVLNMSVSAGSFLSATVTVATAAGVDAFELSSSTTGKQVFANSFNATGSEVFGSSAVLTGANLDTDNFATSDGAMFVNGVKIDYSAGDSTNAFLDKINAKSDLTGAKASINAESGRIEIKSTEYGSQATLNITSGDLLMGPDNKAATTTGTDAKATVTKTSNGATSNVSDQYWNTGKGLEIKDSLGNSVILTEAGGSATGDASSEFTVEANSLVFQVGAYAGQTREVNISSVYSHELGNGAVQGKNVSNLDVTTGSGAQDAIKVLDKAISDVSGIRASLGATQNNVLESSINSLSVAKENLSASESTIRDTDMAAEMIEFTKSQVLQQAGISMLAQANSGSQQLLSLLR